jgi:hypothetical protein
MLADGDARITDAGIHGQSPFFVRREGDLPQSRYCNGYWKNAVLASRKETCQWLLDHDGADIAEANGAGETVWDMLANQMVYVHVADEAVAESTTLLRAMVVRSDPPAYFVAQLRRPEHARMVEEGARLRAALSVYLVRRWALLDAHCPLIPPLLALVRCYDPDPTTTEELWATGLGVAPHQTFWWWFVRVAFIIAGVMLLFLLLLLLLLFGALRLGALLGALLLG